MPIGSLCTLKVVRELGAELIGTGILILVGVSSCINWVFPLDHDEVLRISLTFGFTLTALIYTFGPISGGHFNPALTGAHMITGRINFTMGLLYMIVQFVGGLCGAFFLYILQDRKFIGQETTQFGLTKIYSELHMENGFCVEFAISFIFILSVLLLTYKPKNSDSKSPNDFYGVAIGLLYASLHFSFVNSTGACMNPVRSFAPALIVVDFDQLWVYFVGPFSGGIASGIIYLFFTWAPKETPLSIRGIVNSEIDNSSSGSTALFVSSDTNNSVSIEKVLIENDIATPTQSQNK